MSRLKGSIGAWARRRSSGDPCQLQVQFGGSPTSLPRSDSFQCPPKWSPQKVPDLPPSRQSTTHLFGRSGTAVHQKPLLLRYTLRRHCPSSQHRENAHALSRVRKSHVEQIHTSGSRKRSRVCGARYHHSFCRNPFSLLATSSLPLYDTGRVCDW